MSEPTRHAGGCHCGKVRYEVTIAPDSGMSCNCSMCSKKGTVLSFVEADKFTLKSGESDLSDYQFNKHVIHHLFCKQCGVTSFARGVGPGGKEMVAVNLRCLDGIDLDKVEIKKFDGKSM